MGIRRLDMLWRILGYTQYIPTYILGYTNVALPIHIKYIPLYPVPIAILLDIPSPTHEDIPNVYLHIFIYHTGIYRIYQVTADNR